MSKHYHEFVLEKFFHLTPNIYQIFLHPAQPQDMLHYLAGQFLSILYPDGSYQPFSIANAPQKSGVIELHVRSLAEDQNTKLFIDQLKKQKIARIKGPFGNCVYQDNDKPTLLLAAGTGFAQAKAIIEQAHVIQRYPLLHLYWGVRTPQDFYLAEWIAQWSVRFSDFHFTPVVSKPDPSFSWQGKVGYVHQWAVEDYNNLEDFQVYVSGPQTMTESAFALLREHNLPQEFFYSDFKQ